MQFCMSPEMRHTEPLGLLVSVPACWLEVEAPLDALSPCATCERLNEDTPPRKARVPRLSSQPDPTRHGVRSDPLPISGSELPAQDCKCDDAALLERPRPPAWAPHLDPAYCDHALLPPRQSRGPLKRPVTARPSLSSVSENELDSFPDERICTFEGARRGTLRRGRLYA